MDIKQQKTTISEKLKNKWDEPYNCPRLVSAEIFQGSEQGKGTEVNKRKQEKGGQVG